MISILLKHSAPFLASASLLLTPALSCGQETAPDATAIKAAVDGFHKALATGEAEGVLAFLSLDAVIAEAGAVETREEYQRQHLFEDIAFARAVPSVSLAVVVRQQGDTAWVTNTFRVIGTYQARSVNRLAAETAVLTKTPGGWRIRAIHWSSHRAGAVEPDLSANSSPDPTASPQTKP